MTHRDGLSNCAERCLHLDSADVVITEPDRGDGPHLWRLARDSQVLDLNSSYAYLLWCRDFAATSAVAKLNGTTVGFVVGFLRPEEPDTVMVWQVAVDTAQRGRHLASRMLRAIINRLSPWGVCWLQTTISPSNEASIRLFHSLARDYRTGIERCNLFSVEDFPSDEPCGHEAEDLYVIGPFRPVGIPVKAKIRTREPVEGFGEHF